MSVEKDKTEEIGKQAAALTLIEIGLGSLLHSFKIPLTGHLLSINQIALISRSTFKINSNKASLQISLIASLLKSLSPSGKKLTPMLAIAAQGIFYHLGMSVFGINYIGLFCAVFLSSIWAFVQPILFIYILFGKNSVDVVEYFLIEVKKIFPHSDHLFLTIIVGVILFKFVTAYILSIVAIKMTDKNFDSYHQKMLFEVKFKRASNRSALHSSIRDLFNPLFLVSFSMTALFFIFSHSSQSLTQIIWGLMRPLAVGFILFYTIRVFPVENISEKLRLRGFHQLANMLDIAINETRRF